MANDQQIRVRQKPQLGALPKIGAVLAFLTAANPVFEDPGLLSGCMIVPNCFLAYLSLTYAADLHK